LVLKLNVIAVFELLKEIFGTIEVHDEPRPKWVG
jgi:hypothetical protein